MASALKIMPQPQFGGQVHCNGSGGEQPFTFLPAGPVPQVVSEGASPEYYWGWNEILKLGLRYMRKFTNLLQLVLEDKDPDAVRKMRMASRRLEQILLLIYSKPLPAHARKLRTKAKRCRQLLSDLSDCDVLLTMAGKALARNPSTHLAAWKAVAQFIERRRTRIGPRILQKLLLIEFASPGSKLQKDLEASAASRRVYSDGKFQKLTSEKADKVVQQRIAHSLAHLWREFEFVIEESREDPCEQVIHGIRIATKRLYCLVDVMKKLGTPGSEEALVRLHELQHAIGEWHDLEVLEHVTSELLLDKKFFRDHLELSVQIEQLFLRNREIKKSSEEKFRRMTAKSSDYRGIKSWVAIQLSGRE
jgi:CHAD domain-containing protein